MHRRQACTFRRAKIACPEASAIPALMRCVGRSWLTGLIAAKATSNCVLAGNRKLTRGKHCIHIGFRREWDSTRGFCGYCDSRVETIELTGIPIDYQGLSDEVAIHL
jgi:hypothetical protein